MKYGSVAGINKPVSRLVQGTIPVTSKELERSFKLLDDVFALGCRTFDTAHLYNQGDTERTLGRWLQERGVREQVVIVGKGAHVSVDRKRVTPFDISSDLYDSLARLKVDYIDLYLLHRDDPDVPVGPLMETLNEHLRAGRVHAIGASNWTPQRCAEANAYAQEHGLAPFVASSPNFSLAEQVKPPWSGVITISGPQNQAARDWYAHQAVSTWQPEVSNPHPSSFILQGMPLFTWSSLAGGFFSGRFTRNNLRTFTQPLDKVCIEAYCYEQNFKRLDRAQALARQKGVSVTQVAMAYVFNQPLNIFAVIGSVSGAEFKANLEASEIILTPAELAWLDLRD